MGHGASVFSAASVALSAVSPSDPRLDELHVQLHLDHFPEQTGPESSPKLAAPDLPRRLESGMPAAVPGGPPPARRTPRRASPDGSPPRSSAPLHRPVLAGSPRTRVERYVIVGRFSTSSRSAGATCASRLAFPVSSEARRRSAPTRTSLTVPPTSNSASNRSAAPHLGDPEVTDREVHGGVERVQGPVAGGQGQSGGGRRLRRVVRIHDSTIRRSTPGREAGPRVVARGPPSAAPHPVRSTGE